jgi:hypothetical protein
LQQNAESECVCGARASVREAQQLLVSPRPRALEQSLPNLQRAIGCLEKLAQSLRSGRFPATSNDELRKALGELGRESRTLKALLENAARLYSGWAGWVYSACQYTARGELAAPPPLQRVSVEG